MAIDFDELLRLWTGPPAAVGAEAAFGRFYADPVLLNGTEHTIADLVVRARDLHTAFEGCARRSSTGCRHRTGW